MLDADHPAGRSAEKGRATTDAAGSRQEWARQRDDETLPV